MSLIDAYGSPAAAQADQRHADRHGERARGSVYCADHLIEANLQGHPSHGVGMMPAYVRNGRGGRLHLNQRVQQHGTIAVFDGQLGYGQVVAREAMQWAIETARDSVQCHLHLAPRPAYRPSRTYAEHIRSCCHRQGWHREQAGHPAKVLGGSGEENSSFAPFGL
jgi:Malate/L-lactate dehydrogenase